jgi:hypothetical protein
MSAAVSTPVQTRAVAPLLKAIRQGTVVARPQYVLDMQFKTSAQA